MKEHHQTGLYDSRFEHDACGIGAVISIKGEQSHQVVDNALKIVERLEHRAGKDADGETGDGVGIMLQISHEFFAKHAGLSLGDRRSYGVGMFFFPQNELACSQAKKMLEVITEKEGLTFLGWREVPVNPDSLGKRAKDCMPRICQGFIARPEGLATDLDFDRRIYVIRRVFEQSNDNT